MGNAGGRLGLQIGGMAIGAALGAWGGNVGMGMALGSMAGGIGGALLFPEQGQDSQAFGPRLEDLSVQTSTYGAAIPFGYGTVRIAGNVIWATPLVETVSTRTMEQGGGKGGSPPAQTQTTYSYSASLAIGLVANEIIGIRRIWTDDKLWFDFTDPPVGVVFHHRLYKGTETQMPDPLIEADKGAGNVPGFRGLAYIVFEDLQLEKFGNRIPNFHFEVVITGSELAHITRISDGGNFAWGFLALDPETGLVWETRYHGGWIRSYDPGPMTMVNEFTGLTKPYKIKYQPSFMFLSQGTGGLGTFISAGGLTSPPTVPTEFPAHMWIGSNGFQLIGVNGYSVELRGQNLQTIDNATTNMNSWTGLMLYDTNRIDPDKVFQDTPQSMVMGQTNFGFFSGTAHAVPQVDGNIIYTTYITEFGTGSNFSTSLPDQGVWSVINDWQTVPSAHGIYGVTARGVVFFLNSDTYTMTRFMQPVTPFSVSTFNQIEYDPFDNTVYCCVDSFATGQVIRHILKMDANLTTVLWDNDLDGDPNDHWQIVRVHPSTGQLYGFYRLGLANIWVAELNKATGEIIREFECDYGNNLSDVLIYPDSMFALAIGWGNPSCFAKIPLVPGPTGVTVPLSEVVADLSGRTGLGISDYDTTDLASDNVRGYVVASRMPARSAIEPLASAYFFDGIEVDYAAQFLKRGTASVVAIPTDELAARPSGDNPRDPVQWSRQEENDLPYQVDVRYLDVDSFYKVNNQYARRLTGTSERSMQLQLSLVLTADEAKRIAETTLYNAWIERAAGDFTVTKKYLQLDPSDIVTLPSPLGDRTYRILQTSYTHPGLIEMKAVENDATVYVMTGTGGAGQPTPQTIVGVIPTSLSVLDIPALRSQDNDPGVYLVVSSSMAGWTSATIYRSFDGTTWTALSTVTAPATVGGLNSSLTWEGAIP